MTEYERLLYEQLDMLRRSYEEAAAPIYRQLMECRSRRVEPIIVYESNPGVDLSLVRVRK